MKNKRVPLEREAEHLFEFRFTVFQVSAYIKQDYLVIKQGFKTQIIALDCIRYLYSHTSREREFQELVIATQRGDQGDQLKRDRVYANLNESDFEMLNVYLRSLAPEADISHLSPQEAYAQMGSRDLPWIAIPSVMVLGILILALMTYPLVIHGLDQGHDQLDLEALYRVSDARESSEVLQQLKSYHLSFEGSLALRSAWRSGEEETASFKLLAPLYPSSASDPLPLARVIIRARGQEARQLLRDGADQAHLRVHLNGTARVLFWEGLTSGERQGLTRQGVRFGSNSILIEVGDTGAGDLMFYLFCMGSLSLITALVTFTLKPNSYHKSF